MWLPWRRHLIPFLHLAMAATGHSYTPTYSILLKICRKWLFTCSSFKWFPWKRHICQGGSIAKNVFLDSLSVFAKFQVGNKKCTIQPKFRAMPKDYCNLSFRNVTQRLKHLEPNARLTTTDMWQSILIETYWTYSKASRFCKSELNLNIFVLFEGKANEVYSAVGWDPNVNMLWSICEAKRRKLL